MHFYERKGEREKGFSVGEGEEKSKKERERKKKEYEELGERERLVKLDPHKLELETTSSK